MLKHRIITQCNDTGRNTISFRQDQRESPERRSLYFDNQILNQNDIIEGKKRFHRQLKIIIKKEKKKLLLFRRGKS